LQLLRVNPNYACEIVTACAALHNVATKDDFEWTQSPDEANINDNVQINATGNARIRELLAYFT